MPPQCRPPGRRKRKARPRVAAFAVTVRGLSQPATEGRTFKNRDPLAALRAALDCTDHPATDPVIEWKGCERLGALDVDFHGVPAPDPLEWTRIAHRVQPQPQLFWTTHGGGLRLVYTAAGRLTAEDTAAIARAVLRREMLGESGIELTTRTRHPGYPRGEQRCGAVQ